MMRFIDISDWQAMMNLELVAPSVNAIVVKATQGDYYVSQYCDGFIQTTKKLGKPWGFYHFAAREPMRKVKRTSLLKIVSIILAKVFRF